MVVEVTMPLAIRLLLPVCTFTLACARTPVSPPTAPVTPSCPAPKTAAAPVSPPSSLVPPENPVIDCVVWNPRYDEHKAIFGIARAPGGGYFIGPATEITPGGYDRITDKVRRFGRPLPGPDGEAGWLILCEPGKGPVFAEPTPAPFILPVESRQL
jgi:hypothetical protein